MISYLKFIVSMLRILKLIKLHVFIRCGNKISNLLVCRWNKSLFLPNRPLGDAGKWIALKDGPIGPHVRLETTATGWKGDFEAKLQSSLRRNRNYDRSIYRVYSCGVFFSLKVNLNIKWNMPRYTKSHSILPCKAILIRARAELMWEVCLSLNEKSIKLKWKHSSINLYVFNQQEIYQWIFQCT